MSFNSDVSKHSQGFNFSPKKTVKRKSAQKHLVRYTNV